MYKKKSYFNNDFKDLTSICKNNHIPIKYIEDINSNDSLGWIKNCKPDIIFCFGWSNLIKDELLNLAPMGIVGFHPAYLPKNRGRHPLIWALVLGLKKSASTFFFMDDGADSGDILSQKEFNILYEDDANSLYQKVINVALEQIEEFVPQLENKNYLRVEQNHLLANIWRKRAKVDGIIDFRMTSNAIYNLVRGLTKPYIGASVVYDDTEIIVWKVEEIEINMTNIEFGKILEVKDNMILVKTYDNAIRLIEHEFKILPKVGEYL
jgi:methionyl-tRNA formyltransferase